MFKTKSVLKKLNGFIDTIRNNINNEDVLDYIITNMNIATKKGATISFQGDNSVIIVDSLSDSAFYVEFTPSMDVIDRVYTRLTKAAGAFDERMTVTFDQDMVKIGQYSSSISKDKDDARITSISDSFINKTFVNGDIRYTRHFSTNISYPLINNAAAASTLEEVIIHSDGMAAFKRIGMSSLNGDSHSYGTFDARKNEFTSKSYIDELVDVEPTTEEEYQTFLNEAEPRIIKELK